MICKSDKISGCSFYGTVCILRNLKCPVMCDHFNPCILRTKFFQNSGKRWICATSIGKTQLPVWIGLLLHRLCQSPQILFRSFIKRNNNRNLRTVWQFCSSLFLKLCFSRKMTDDPFLIWNFSCRSCLYFGNDLPCKCSASLGFPVMKTFFCISVHFLCQNFHSS